MLLIAVNLNRSSEFDEDVAEGVALTESAGFYVAQVLTANRLKSRSKFFFVGSGKLDEIKTLCDTLKPSAIVINHNISRFRSVI